MQEGRRNLIETFLAVANPYVSIMVIADKVFGAHIIIFSPVEMRWDTMVHIGNPAAVTSLLDKFTAAEVISFEHAFCQNPVYVPSRCVFLQACA